MTDFEQKLLLDVHGKVTTLVSDVSETKTNLKEHMRRTAINEARIEMVQKQIYYVQGALAFVVLIASLYKALI
jgi:hypothetical protein